MAKDATDGEAAHRAIRERLAQPPVVELPLPGRTLRLTSACVVTAEGAEKPACVAEFVTLVYE